MTNKRLGGLLTGVCVIVLSALHPLRAQTCEGSCDNFGLCVPDALKQLQPCTDGFGDCTTNDVCLETICLGTFKQCPDVDQNKCTREFCDVATGQCDLSGPVLCGTCGQCNQ